MLNERSCSAESTVILVISNTTGKIALKLQHAVTKTVLLDPTKLRTFLEARAKSLTTATNESQKHKTVEIARRHFQHKDDFANRVVAMSLADLRNMYLSDPRTAV